MTSRPAANHDEKGLLEDGRPGPAIVGDDGAGGWFAFDLTPVLLAGAVEEAVEVASGAEAFIARVEGCEALR